RQLQALVRPLPLDSRGRRCGARRWRSRNRRSRSQSGAPNRRIRDPSRKWRTTAATRRDTREFGKRLLRENLASEKDLLNDPVTNPNLDDGGCENGERQEEPDCCRTSNGRNQACGIQCPMARGCNQEQSEHNDAETSADD